MNRSSLVRFVAFPLAITFNLIAFISSLYWAYIENFGYNKTLSMEPIVTSLTLLATFFALFYVNNKLSAPHIKSVVSYAFTTDQNGAMITLENHSNYKIFIQYIYVDLIQPNTTPKKLVFKHDALHRNLMNFSIEPAASFSFMLSEKSFHLDQYDKEHFGDLFITTDLGYLEKIKKDKIHEAIDTIKMYMDE